MMQGLKRLVRDLSGRSDRVFADALQGQLRANRVAADLMLGTVRGDPDACPPEQLSERLGEIEAEGDRWRGRLIKALSEALSTPMDREDLFRLSRSIDDVLDNLRDFAREYALYQPGNGAVFVPVLETLVEGVPALHVAVEDLMRSPQDAVRSAHSAKQVANALRAAYEDGIATLFQGELTMDVLKCRELLRRLDVVGLRFAESADALADGALKRGH